MAKTKVFISFDFDNDKVLKHFIIGQAKLPDSPFEIADFSLKEAAPEKDWEAKAEAAIKRCDVFVVMLGPKTVVAPGVLKEVLLASKHDKPRVQIIGYSGGKESWALPGAGRTYAWNWENLKRLLG